MAARCQAMYSSTPASLIYAQSWPVPSSHSLGKRYPEKTASNSPKKSLNSPWIYEVKKPKATQHTASPTAKSHTWATSMLNNHYPEWIEGDTHVHIELDMAQEFKLTLEMFKRLTQQVTEVDEQLNLGKNPYSFKHYFKNDGPGIYRSQLASRMRSFTPEIPMTNQPHQPCDNFGSKREHRPQSHLGVHRTSDKSVHKMIPKSKPKADNLLVSHQTHVTKSNVCKAEQEKHLKKQRYPLTLKPDSLEARNKCNWFSSSEFNDEESEDFGYIDPIPADWNERKLEELEQEFCSKKSQKADAFIIRYLQLLRLQADTLENERCNPRTDDSIENLCGLTCESQKTSGNSQGKKLCGNVKHSSKTSVEKTKLGEKSSVENSKKFSKLNSLPLHCVSASVFKPASGITSKYNKSCFSKYGEGNLKEKQAVGHRKKEAKTVTCSTRRGKCSSAKGVRKISNGNVIQSTKSCQSCSVAVYDIVQLASSFEPPCKDRIKSASRPVTAKSAKSKGLLPGKSWHSQRRFSLTSDQTFGPMATDTRVPVSKPSSAKGRQKSAKKSRRCASSRL